jgi:hypothetical protein
MIDPAIKRIREEFASVHEIGMYGLRNGDYAAMGAAIKRERELIAELIALSRSYRTESEPYV